VADKLKERLQCPLDDLDRDIAGVMFNSKGEMDTKPVPGKYEYVSGAGQI
jgi:hypothetical protein